MIWRSGLVSLARVILVVWLVCCLVMFLLVWCLGLAICLFWLCVCFGGLLIWLGCDVGFCIRQTFCGKWFSG